MKRSILILVLSGLAGGLGMSGAAAQDGPVLNRVNYMQVKPGQREAFAAARLRQIEHRREHGYPWREFVSINENGVVRIATRLNNGWEDMGAMREWRRSTPFVNTGMRETVDFLGSEVTESLPEYGYMPEDRRVPQGEVNFSREVRIFPNPGRARALREFLTVTVRDAFQEAGSGQMRFLRQSVLGRGGFSFIVVYPARDVQDAYASREAISAILASARGNSEGGNIRRTRFSNWTWMRDLGFNPAD